MAFIYEKVKEEDYGLFDSLEFKDFWKKESLKAGRHTYWCYDKENAMYLVAVGTFIDAPRYYDFSYKGRIIRLEYKGRGNGNKKEGWVLNHSIVRLFVPNSVFIEKEEIKVALTEAFSKWIHLCLPDEINNVIVDINCVPEMVEADYNGR